MTDLNTVSEVVVTAAPRDLRRPRAIIQVNGEDLDGWLRWESDENEFYTADTATVTFGMSALPKDRGRAYWASLEKAEIEIFAAANAPDEFTVADLDSVFAGVVDQVSFDWVDGTISLTCRDLTSRMIDTKTSEKFVNLTASKVVEQIAAKHGLNPVVTATSEKVGNLYQREQVDLQAERTEWDLLTWLANQEQFVVYVRGRDLHFEPKPQAGSAGSFVIEIKEVEGIEEGNFESFSTSRDLGLSSEIKVTVKSWNTKAKKAFTRTATRKGRGRGDKIERSYTIPNLTPEQTQARANQLLAELSKHAMRLDFGGPASGALHIEDVIEVRGTGTAFDQVYYPESIVRSMAFEGGYTWAVGAKNTSPESEPTL